MNRPQHENVDFFIGTEVEHSPALGKKTLFVVGLKTPQEIQKILDDPFSSINSPIEHIYFGANQSFPKLLVNDFQNWSSWEHVIEHFLSKNYWCTLDLDVTVAEGLLESGLCEHQLFIPMISVKLPYVTQLGYNATIKIDDRDFNFSNPGVWCHDLHGLLDRKNHTNWTQYTKDTVIDSLTDKK